MSQRSSTTGKTVTPSVPAGPMVPHEKIAQRAYEKWLAGGCIDGTDQQNWLEAECELKTEMKTCSKAQSKK